MYISEVIANDVENWRAGDVILIDAPTGTGKTTAVLGKMRSEAMRRGKEILYISNRKMLQRQIQAILGAEIGYPLNDDSLWEVDRFDGICVTSYQKIQAQVKTGISFSLEDFCFVVFDEFHYLLADAMFQPEIFFFLRWLERCNRLKCKTLIFISATPEQSLEFLVEKTKVLAGAKRKSNMRMIQKTPYCEIAELYEEPVYRKKFAPKFWRYKIPDVGGYVPYFYKEEDHIIKLIMDDKSDEKWLIFIAQKAVGKKMFERLVKELGINQVSYLSAEEIGNENDDVVAEIVKNQKFSGKVLITTKVLENGVSLCDGKLKNIVLSTIWHDEFIQMIGRKRREEGEIVKIFMNCKTLNSLNGVRNRVLLPIYAYMKVHPSEITEKILDDTNFYHYAKNFLIYEPRSNRWNVNPAAKYLVKKRLDFVERMMEEIRLDENAFAKEQLRWLGIACGTCEIKIVDDINSENEEERFLEYLQCNCGKKLDKQEQMRFREYFAEIYFSNKRKKHDLPGLYKINSVMKERTKFWVISQNSASGTIWRIEKREHNDE